MGSTYVAFGDGAVWTANYVDGSVSRIDPRTNTVTARVQVGAAQALAAGAGSAWVSVAGGTRDGVLPASTCSEVASGGRKPDVLIASDLPLQGPDGAGPRGMADAIGFVLKDHGFEAGGHVVGYQSCDDSTAQTGSTEERKCAANANAYASAERLVAVIGPYHSRCARVEIPILNRAPGGPLALISPSNTHPNLTRGGRLALPAPAWRQGRAGRVLPHRGAQLPARHRPRRPAGRGPGHARKAAPAGGRLPAPRARSRRGRLGDGPIPPGGPTAGDQGRGFGVLRREAKSYNALADRVARSGAEGVLIGAEIWYGGDRLLKALRARLGPRATIMAGDGFSAIPDVLERAGRAARGLYVATSELPPDALDLTPAGDRFTRDFGAAAHEEFALHAAQATEVVLQAIARSDGTRASVLRELRAIRVKDGILGDFRFDRYGDITPAKITIFRVTGSTPPDLQSPEPPRGCGRRSCDDCAAEAGGVTPGTCCPPSAFFTWRAIAIRKRSPG